MMITSVCNSRNIIVIASLLFLFATVRLDTRTAAAAGQPDAEVAVPAGNVAGGPPTDEGSEDEAPASGFFPIEAIHEMIREERKRTLMEVDKDIRALLEHLTQERLAVLLEIENLHKATLDYITGEQKTVMEQLIKESNRITNLLVAERRTTMLELEVAGNRIVEGALQSSERVIDHIFIRLSQLLLVVVVGLSIIAWIIFRVFVSRSKVS